MPVRRHPTARQVRLGTQLRRLREAAGLKATEAAQLLGANSAQMSQIESGLSGVSEQRLRRLTSHYACTDDRLIDSLAAMATDRSPGWWDEYQGLLPAAFLDLAQLEAHATFLDEVALPHIPGLLQTEDYAHAVYSFRVPQLTEQEIELRVRHRMQRKAVIEGAAPVPYKVVIHETALRIRVRDRSATRVQLHSLLEMSDAEHVTLRVVPFDLDDFAGATSTMKYAGGAVPELDTVVRDAPHGTAFIDSADQLATFRTIFRKVKAASLEPDQSRDFIRRLTKEL